MKKDIHPKYQPLKVIIGSDVMQMNSTSTSGELLMDIDFRKHPAWTKSNANVVNQANEKVSKFASRFKGLSSATGA
jgi:large subunit ribosomal protein L31